MRRYSLVLCFSLATGTGFAQPATSTIESQRSEFRTAYELARTGSVAAAEDSESLRSYALYPYLEAARLGRALGGSGNALSAADAAVADFLLRHDGEPVSLNLRLAWLQSLATRDLWEPFREHYRAEVADTGLRCRHLIARIELGDLEGIAPLILEAWLSPLQLPAECEPAFEWLRNAGPLDDEATAARVRLLLENGEAGFARIVARRLPADRARPLLAWADLIERPFASITAYLRGAALPIDAGMLLDGWSRLARDEPDAALELYEDLLESDLVAAEGAGAFDLALALGLAWDRRPEALEVYARIPAALRDDYALGWQARAALWAGETAIAQTAIAAMSSEQLATSQWQYWTARVSDEDDEAARRYEQLRPSDNFFAAAAAAQLHERPDIHPVTHAADEPLIAEIAANPGMVRSRELRLAGLPVAAAREWSQIYATLDPDARAQSVHLAVDLGWYDLAIVTATELGIFFDYALLYPRPWPDAIAAAADEFDLDPSLIYAVMRQESLYRADAESAAGAFGLMQLQRGTARDVSRELDGAAAGSPDLLDPAVNIRLGAARLASLIERYDGLIVPALAAYNAGPAAVDRWLPAAPIAGDIWLENIPFNETREYVRRVLWHSVVFERLEGDRMDARAWLREIGRG